MQTVPIVSGCNDNIAVRDYTKNLRLARKAFATNLILIKGCMYVEIYGTKNCKYCDMAKKLVESKEIKFSYTDVADQEERANLNLRLGSPARSVPQIFVDGKHIGGYNELYELI